MRKPILLLALLTGALHAAAPERPWTDDVMYFAMTDRFFDGDPANNKPAGSDPALYDPHQKDIARYMGGDLRGMEKALQSGYFNELGITAIWLTPVVANVWRSGYDLGGWKTGYHGYWTQDWLDIDPHLTSATRLDGSAYPEGAEGRMEHYRDFVKLAHSKGIKVIQDVVMNHAGPVFFYDANGNGTFDVQHKDEWVQEYKRDGYHANATWADLPQWNARRTEPDGPRKLLGVDVPTSGVLSRLDAYGRKGFSGDSLGKSDGEEVMCDFFSLRDLWTAPDGRYFDELVDEFVAIYQFYLETVGVDGLRIDTVKHVHHEFWDAFAGRLRKKLGDAAAEKLMFGEIYDGRPDVLGRYTWRSDWPERTDPALDSVLDFNFCFAAREYLRHPGKHFGSPAALEKAMAARTGSDNRGRPYFNPNPGADGISPQQELITFIENHDGLNRFRAGGVTARRNRLAQALVLTLPGIPCLYYGTEFALPDAEGPLGHDSETGRLMFFRRKDGPTMEDVTKSRSFQEIARVAALRAKLPELRTGSFRPVWSDSGDGPEDDGVFAFVRADEKSGGYCVVAMNASDDAKVTAAGPHVLRLPSSLPTSGMTLKPVLVTGSAKLEDIPSFPADGPLRLEVPHSSLVVYQAVPAGESSSN
ncbi:MAG: hypothetical protein H7A49_12720 [Akkermansiaceae bacterium]|nr:hypothetical protein [Akkermansiaceae bacterium]MCP5545897.1 hypothetical protein [Akkermansiaceae bacterium]